MWAGAGILTGYPSATPFGFALGPPNPWLIVIAKETLGFRWAGLSPALRLLMPTFSLLLAPPSLTVGLRCQEDAPLPRAHKKFMCSALSSVLSFSPVNLRRRAS